jgi:hypothetical protein
MLRRLQAEAGLDAETARLVYERQMVPAMRAAQLIGQGYEVDLAQAQPVTDGDDGGPGFLVRCYGCGRRARVQVSPGRRRLLCPECVP